MMPTRPPRLVVRTAAAAIVVCALLLSTGCGSDDSEDRSSSEDRTESTPVTQAPTSSSSGGISDPVNFGVTAFDPATGVLSGAPIDSTETGPDLEGGSLIVDAQTEIVVQGPQRPEKLALDQLDPWIRQRLADLGDTAGAVTMEITYQAVDDQLRVITLTEVPPG